MCQLFIFNKPPYGSDVGKETLDMALAFATFDQSTSLLFLDAGVFQLLENQHPKLIGQKEYTRLFNGLDLYDIEQMYVAESALKQFHLTEDQLFGSPQILSNDDVRALIQNHTQVTCL